MAYVELGTSVTVNDVFISTRKQDAYYHLFGGAEGKT